jgi:hypothetical protein
MGQVKAVSYEQRAYSVRRSQTPWEILRTTKLKVVLLHFRKVGS